CSLQCARDESRESSNLVLPVSLGRPGRSMPSSPHSHEAICSGTSPVPVLEFGIPDFGTPDDANSFASFVKEICEHSKRRQNVLIHCEGGIGRTGMVAQYVL